MDTLNALKILSALSQDTRLNIFRLLIKSGAEGLLSGEMSKKLSVRQNTLSANLTILLGAGLVRNERSGRTIRYFVDFETVHHLLQFLLEDCCGGDKQKCDAFIAELTSC